MQHQHFNVYMEENKDQIPEDSSCDWHFTEAGEHKRYNRMAFRKIRFQPGKMDIRESKGDREVV